ncbi:Ser/Thr protein phosphatase family protein [Pelomyxa schiedti]|nr:Ser/Thr protein phosphatase family protein [Pelomyxa schiedti]
MRTRIRCVGVSDTHGAHRDLDMTTGVQVHVGVEVDDASRRHDEEEEEEERVNEGEDGDGDGERAHEEEEEVFIHAGDWSGAHLDDFVQWVGALPYKHKLIIAGNSDMIAEFRPDDVRTKFAAVGATYLRDETVTIRGVNFYGSPWTPPFVGAFQMRNPSQATSTWSRIPADTHVLITHGPAYGILDRTRRGTTVGCSALLSRLRGMAPMPLVHVFGHVHESHGTTAQGGTTFLNVSGVPVHFSVSL